MTITRKKLRELSMQLLYQYEFYPDPELDAQVRLFLEQQDDLEEEDREMILKRMPQIFEKIESIDQEITEKAEGWSISRMSKVDLSIIRLALFEIHYDDQTPEKVAINEAVELAKSYGGEESPKFINGVLARMIRES